MEGSRSSDADRVSYYLPEPKPYTLWGDHKLQYVELGRDEETDPAAESTSWPTPPAEDVVLEKETMSHLRKKSMPESPPVPATVTLVPVPFKDANLDGVCMIGKYKGMSFRDIFTQDPKWMECQYTAIRSVVERPEDRENWALMSAGWESWCRQHFRRPGETLPPGGWCRFSRSRLGGQPGVGWSYQGRE